jgi:HTH-type transcriptional regulator/antitoxin HipB
LVRDRRENLGLSQEELARQVGVSRLWIGLLEKGKSTSRVGLVLRTLDVLGVVLEVGKKPLPLPGSISLDEVLKSRTGKGAA